jgi:hypothetical protein
VVFYFLNFAGSFTVPECDRSRSLTGINHNAKSAQLIIDEDKEPVLK